MGTLESKNGVTKRLHPTDAENALVACAYAGDWARGYRTIEAIKRLHPDSLMSEVQTPLSKPGAALLLPGIICERSGRRQEAFSHIIQATELVEIRRNEVTDPDLRRQSLAAEIVGEIFPCLVRLCLRADEQGVHLDVINTFHHRHRYATSWKEHALLFLEQSQARSLLDALEETRSIS